MFRPIGLVPSPGNLAPAILVFYASGNCGLNPPGGLISLAASDRFVVVAMEIPCGGIEDWRMPARLEVLFHVPIAVIEGMILGFTLGFLARVKPEMLGWKASGLSVFD